MKTRVLIVATLIVFAIYNLSGNVNSKETRVEVPNLLPTIEASIEVQDNVGDEHKIIFTIPNFEVEPEKQMEIEEWMLSHKIWANTE